MQIGTIAGTCVGNIEFAQQFAQHFGEVVIVVDMRQEFAVGLGHSIPIYSMQVLFVEAFLYLQAYMVEHGFPFVGEVHFQTTLYVYRSACAGHAVDFLQTTAQQVNIAFCIRFEGAVADAFLCQLRCAFLHV